MKIKNTINLVFMVFFMFTISIANLYALDMQQLAFPEAEESGQFANGGRGGSVYEVTTLSNFTKGSIVDAVSSGNRTIVFRVSGTIELESVILTQKSNTTISAAQAQIDVLAMAGASYPACDIIDTRIVNDVVNLTGHSIATTDDQSEGAWSELQSLLAPADDEHDGMLEAGVHALEFNGAGLSSGLYFARLQSEASTETLNILMTD